MAHPSHRTRTLSIATAEARADHPAILEAAAILRAGGLVAFPTETVYGLGADATNAEAVARIFEAKGRPARNPLIVHAASLEMARSCIKDFGSPGHEAVARQRWPGPLTLIFYRSAIIPDIVTAGLPTVGVRVPASPVARALIEALGRPIAAPSANRSSGLSPTTAQHVLKDLDGRIDLILDAGPTELGIESTIIDMTGHYERLLRPGPVSQEELIVRAGLSLWPGRADPLEDQNPLPSPGRMRVHYAPRTPAHWVEPGQLGRWFHAGRGAIVVMGAHELPDTAGFETRINLPTPEEAARRLYATLHELDAQALDFIAIVPPPDRPEWQAIRDRIARATAPRDRP